MSRSCKVVWRTWWLCVMLAGNGSRKMRTYDLSCCPLVFYHWQQCRFSGTTIKEWTKSSLSLGLFSLHACPLLLPLSLFFLFLSLSLSGESILQYYNDNDYSPFSWHQRQHWREASHRSSSPRCNTSTETPALTAHRERHRTCQKEMDNMYSNMKLQWDLSLEAELSSPLSLEGRN